MLGPVSLASATPNAAALLAAGYDRVKWYRSATVDGTYAEITTGSTRPLIYDTAVQTFTDLTGQAGNYYKWSFLNTHVVPNVETGLSNPTLGDGDPALDVLSVSELKEEFLFGVPLLDTRGNELSDRAIANIIRAAVAEVEQRVDIVVGLKTITGEQVDYIRSEFEQYMFMKVVMAPIVAITEISLVLPTNQKAITYDLSWIFTNVAGGQIQIVPGTGQILLGQASWMALTTGYGRMIPNVFRVSYLAGFANGAIPADIRQLVGQIASLPILRQIGDMILGLGIAARSTTIDGVTTSQQTTQSHQDGAFSSRARELKASIDATVKQLRVNYHGIPLWVA